MFIVTEYAALTVISVISVKLKADICLPQESNG